MKIYITVPGDSSVGIPDGHAEIEVYYQNAEDLMQWRDGDRNTLRKEIATFFSDNIFGDKCHVLFEDECPDCHAMRREDMPGCPNEGCPTNMKDEYEEPISAV